MTSGGRALAEAEAGGLSAARLTLPPGGSVVWRRCVGAPVDRRR